MMNSDFKNKTILLAVPNHFGLPEVFRKNLEFLGFKVFILKQTNEKPKLTFSQSITHFYRKTFTNDPSFKAKITTIFKEIPQLEFLENIEKTDYALVIRPDLLSEQVLKKIKSKSNFSVAYQWDGMSRFPLAKETIQFFDQFFVFDRDDTIAFPGTKHTDNFYFDYLPSNLEENLDVFFVGTYMKDRIKELVNLSKIFQKLGLRTSINVIYTKDRHIKNYEDAPMNFTKKGLTFEENIAQTKTSAVILDFQNSFHKGLSFRTFEAIGYGKKLITNNVLVKNYEFYNSKNIFVIENNIAEISKFIEQEKEILPAEIVKKYSFSSWILKTLNIV